MEASAREGSQHPPAASSRITFLAFLPKKRTDSFSSPIIQLTRNFQNRLALAAFKTQRGWQDVALDVIEPHLEQEAAQRVFHAQQEALQQEQLQQQQYQYEQEMLQNQTLRQHHQHQEGDMGPPPIHNKRVRGISGNNAGINGGAGLNQPSLYDDYHHPPMPASPLYSSYTSHDPYHQDFSSSAAYSPAASTSTLPPVPPATTANHQRTLSSSSSFRAIQSSPVLDPHRQRRRQPSGASDAHTTLDNTRSSPLRRPRAPSPSSSSSLGTAGPSSPRRTKRSTETPRRTPLSSSDPNFSSFVDAATALTGLSRAPSVGDLMEFGDGEEGGRMETTPPPVDSTTTTTRTAFLTSSTSKIVSNGVAVPLGSTNTTGNGNGIVPGPVDPSFLLRRPRTPERGSIFFDPKGKSVAPSSLSKVPNSESANTTSDAAELMLFLAASPSPAQRVRSSNPLGLGGIAEAGGGGGGGGMMKGRRLFSAGEDTLAPLAPQSPPIPNSNSNSTCTNSNSNSNSFVSLSPPKTTTTSTIATTTPRSPPPGLNSTHPILGGAPSTPSRERQVSFGAGGTAAWEAYLNVSPSPSRGTSGKTRIASIGGMEMEMEMGLGRLE